MPATLSGPHLIIKRGHRGRYRLTLLSGGVRISGIVALDMIDRAEKSNDETAISCFRDAASTLITQLERAQVKP